MPATKIFSAHPNAGSSSKPLNRFLAANGSSRVARTAPRPYSRVLRDECEELFAEVRYCPVEG